MRLPISQELRYHRARGGVTSGQTNTLKENDGGNDTVVNRSGLVVADVQQGLTYGRGLFSLEDDLYAVFDDKVIKYGYSPTDQRLGLVDITAAYGTTMASPTRFVLVRFPRSSFDLQTVAVSTDGVTWAVSNMPTTDRWRRGVWDGSQFIMVGAAGNNAAMNRYITSADGVTWATNTFPFTAQLHDIAVNGTKLLAAGGDYMVYSPDAGVTWTKVLIGGYDGDTNTEIFWWKVESYGSGFCLQGYNYNYDTNAVASLFGLTFDGATLTYETITTAVYTSTNPTGLIGTNGNIVLYINSIDGDNQDAKISGTGFISEDGRNFNQIDLPDTLSWSVLTVKDGNFVLLGNDIPDPSELSVPYSTSTKAYMSKNGVTWEEIEVPLGFVWHGAEFGINGLVLVGSITNPGWLATHSSLSVFIPSAQPLPVDYEITIDGETTSMVDFALGL